MTGGFVRRGGRICLIDLKKAELGGVLLSLAQIEPRDPRLHDRIACIGQRVLLKRILGTRLALPEDMDSQVGAEARGIEAAPTTAYYLCSRRSKQDETQYQLRI